MAARLGACLFHLETLSKASLLSSSGGGCACGPESFLGKSTSARMKNEEEEEEKIPCFPFPDSAPSWVTAALCMAYLPPLPRPVPPVRKLSFDRNAWWPPAHLLLANLSPSLEKASLNSTGFQMCLNTVIPHPEDREEASAALESLGWCLSFRGKMQVVFKQPRKETAKNKSETMCAFENVRTTNQPILKFQTVMNCRGNPHIDACLLSLPTKLLLTGQKWWLLSGCLARGHRQTEVSGSHRTLREPVGSDVSQKWL